MCSRRQTPISNWNLMHSSNFHVIMNKSVIALCRRNWNICNCNTRIVISFESHPLVPHNDGTFPLLTVRSLFSSSRSSDRHRVCGTGERTSSGVQRIWKTRPSPRRAVVQRRGATPVRRQSLDTHHEKDRDESTHQCSCHPEESDGRRGGLQLSVVE